MGLFLEQRSKHAMYQSKSCLITINPYYSVAILSIKEDPERSVSHQHQQKFTIEHQNILRFSLFLVTMLSSSVITLGFVLAIISCRNGVNATGHEAELHHGLSLQRNIMVSK